MLSSIFKSYRVGSPFGVDVFVHGTTLALLAFFSFHQFIGGGIAAGLSVAAVIGAVMVFVTLHELGHIFAAKAFGIGTTGLTLYPIGGVARLTREAGSPLEEFVIAVAGPAVNVVLAALGFAGMLLLPVASSLFEIVVTVNVGLAIFNMIPAYPMDGGRVLRGLLWYFVGKLKATRFAARIGQGFAVLFGLVGLMFGPGTLMLISVFIFMQASSEYRRATAMEQMQFAQQKTGRGWWQFNDYYDDPWRQQSSQFGYQTRAEPKAVVRRTASGRIVFFQDREQ